MVRVVWSRGALNRLRGIAEYVGRDDPAAADRLVNRLFDAGNSLVEFPARGRPASNGMRELASVPPYVLRYRLNSSGVLIIAIKHGRQRG